MRYIIQQNTKIYKELKMNIEASMIVELDQIIDITTAPLSKVLSFTMSLTKKYIVIGTENGFCLVDNVRKSFKRFENDNNPFKKQLDTGVELGTALQERSQVALIPSKRSKNYSKTTVYIFDYNLKTILYSNDFFLPIRQLTITDNTIIVSNNKRIIIYNYSNDLQQKNQSYYLRMYASKQQNTNLRYLQMSCQQKLMNNSIQQMDDGGQNKYIRECFCGKYVISGTKPYKMVYSKVYTLNGTKMIQLSIYDWAYDKDYVFQSFNYNQPFSFNISEDGNYVVYTDNYGKNAIVHKLNEKGIYCVLTISSSIKSCISHGFFMYDDSLWYTSIRRGDNSTGHMHFFKVQKRKQQKQIIKSRYSRYFSLYEKTMSDYGICDHLIGPDYYVINGAVFAPSVCGTVTEIIDFRITGNHDKKNAQNMIKWVEDLS